MQSALAQPAYRHLITRPPPELRQRLAVAAAEFDTATPRYCRRLLTTWLRGVRLAPVSSEPLVGMHQEYRIPMTPQEHRELRVEAARHDISVNELTLRVLSTACPYENELVAARVERGESP